MQAQVVAEFATAHVSSNNISEAERRARVMSRELKSVEALPETRAQALLPLTAQLDVDPDVSETET